MGKLASIIIFLLALSVSSKAQHNNIWYFGKLAGLNFNAAPGQPIPSSLTNSAMSADEGSSSICDADGNLLFYTNGINVYNRNHQLMLNGGGLLGNISSVQSSLIVPAPGQPDIYYIFTTDAVENSFNNGFRQSIVDMSKDGGLGEVVSKNSQLSSLCTERLAAVRHADGSSVWVLNMAPNSSIIEAWLFTCGNPAPSVVYNSGVEPPGNHILANTGMMKVSPDGKTLVITHFPEFDEYSTVPNFFQLYDFDNATGLVSNYRKIQSTDAGYYTCEFSADSRMLYVTRPRDSCIDQFDVSLSSVPAIAASRYVISTGRSHFYGILLGPDEKIYLSQPSFYLGAINRPNLAGPACGYVEEQVDLNYKLGYLGLPNYVNDASYNPYNGFDYTIIDSCAGLIQFQGKTNMAGPVTWLWDFGDGTTSTIQNPLHSFNPVNKAFVVKLTITSTGNCGVLKRTRIITPAGISNGVSFEVENRCDSGFVRFRNTNPLPPGSPGVFTWDFGDGNTSTETNPVHVYSSPGLYRIVLKLTTPSGCLDESADYMLDYTTFVIKAPPTQSILVGETVPLWVDGRGVSYKWTPGTWLSDSLAKNPVAQPLEDITYKITVTNPDGCISEDSVFIKVTPLDDIYVPTAFTPNNDGKNDVIRPWFNGKFNLIEFSIFNRWGEKVYSTSQRGAGWNGKINGTIQTPGVYAWLVVVKDGQGKKLNRKGTITLIR